MNSNKTVSWGIIGAGDVCEKKSGPGFYKAPNSRLAAITKRSEEGAADFARRHNVPKWYTDPQRLIDDPEVDAVYVATPPYLHRTYAEASMLAGKPVLVEKPMATSIADCDAMLNCSIKTGIPLWVAYYRRGLEKFIAIKEALSIGVIGEPRSVLIEFSQDCSRYKSHEGEGLWRVDPLSSGAGIVADIGSHMLDLLDWFLGTVSPASSLATNRGGNYKAEDIVAATIIVHSRENPDSYVSGSALWDFSGRTERDRTVIRGSEGTLEYSTFDDKPVLLQKDGSVSEMDQKAFPDHVHQAIIEMINNEIRGGVSAPCDAISAARTNRVLEALVSPYYSRKQMD
ncbi:Gfo/Idh/MocA family oxidoreductase [Marispirochaeta sp.]|jgi:1,5-anhydro-D-fructose reductase (1,5-anhydro-D-mannitol-forming)|uniref:Gfo/Idh/MocA family protein n=1 Tax=Marispirochaeta sp. TaxID=2038653 RepID=UPI0029C9587E|nr:Gfo/Idh/MocA family oxidoreductase [Marispirochaeta sp.]